MGYFNGFLSYFQAVGDISVRNSGILQDGYVGLRHTVIEGTAHFYPEIDEDIGCHLFDILMEMLKLGGNIVMNVLQIFV